MNVNAVARIASLIGEPARTTMLLELMDGRAMTAGELARAARISPATASRHLALMTEAKLLHAAATGRHRYLRIASPEVASLLERMLQFASQSATGSQRIQTGPTDASLRRARTCYDHLAGRLGVAIAERLAESGAIAIEPDALRVTERMGDALTALGIEGASDAGARLTCRPCMDWSERRIHLAGRLGTAICRHCLARGWLMQKQGARAIGITPSGQIALRDWLGLERWSAVAE